MDASVALKDCLISENVAAEDGEPANVVDAIELIALATRAVARAITPASATGGTDMAGGHVESLTEAVMGITAGMCQIADAINNLADAVRDK